jgi:hypothetical protein
MDVFGWKDPRILVLNETPHEGENNIRQGVIDSSRVIMVKGVWFSFFPPWAYDYLSMTWTLIAYEGGVFEDS